MTAAFNNQSTPGSFVTVGHEQLESDAAQYDMNLVESFKNTMDEVRVSSIDRSGDWIRAEVANVNAVETFIYTLGGAGSEAWPRPRSSSNCQ